MRKVIGIGETILDYHLSGKPAFRSRTGRLCIQRHRILRPGWEQTSVSISETGNDRVGNIILQFMRDNISRPTM